MQQYLLPVNNQPENTFNKFGQFKIKKSYLFFIVGLISLFGVESTFACSSGTTQILRTSGSINTTENLTDCTSVVAPSISNGGTFTTAYANFNTNGSVFITNTINEAGVRLFTSSGNNASFQGTADSHLSIFVINDVGTNGNSGALYSQWSNSTITGSYANFIAASSIANGHSFISYDAQVLLDHGAIIGLGVQSGVWIGSGANFNLDSLYIGVDTTIGSIAIKDALRSGSSTVSTFANSVMATHQNDGIGGEEGGTTGGLNIINSSIFTGIQLSTTLPESVTESGGVLSIDPMSAEYQLSLNQVGRPLDSQGQAMLDPVNQLTVNSAQAAANGSGNAILATTGRIGISGGSLNTFGSSASAGLISQGNSGAVSTSASGLIDINTGTISNTHGTTQINTFGTYAYGLFASTGGIVNVADTHINTQGDGSAGIYINGVTSQVNIQDEQTFITTKGNDAHAIAVVNGAKTFDGTAGNFLPIATVYGDGSAVLDAFNSLITLSNSSALSITMTLGANTWGVKAENGGTVRFEGNSRTGGTGLWANDGVLELADSADAAGSRVLLDNGSSLNLAMSGVIGSLEGDSSTAVNLNGYDLSIGANNSSNNGSLRDNADYVGSFTNADSSALIKVGNTTQILSGTGNSVNAVTVAGGRLDFEQLGAFSTLGNYTTQSGATTMIGASGSTLEVGGVFTQQSNSSLDVILGASPDITAQSAQLDGMLEVKGFVDRDTPVTASSAINNGYILLHTEEGISGDFANNAIGGSGLDYLLRNGEVVNNVDYELDFHLAWTQGGQNDSTGSFTLYEGTGFDVDIALNNQAVPTGGFDTGWDGQSLVKEGTGRLVLSAVNGYTGSTTVKEGVLQFNIADSIANSRDIIVNGGVIELNGYDQQFNRLAGTGGEIRLNGAVLTANNANLADNSQYAGAITGSGSFIKKGDGSLTLSGNTAWVGDTELQTGTLILDGSTGGAQLTSNIIGQDGSQLTLRNGAILTGWIDPTDVSVESASQWNMTNNSLVNNLSNGGAVAFVAPTMDDFKTLTVKGNYAGNNGLLVMNTQLGSDSSLTDKLIVEGNTTGMTRVQINNAGGSGAKTLNGIEVITVGGQSEGEFVQAGRIAAGAYDYTLARGSAGNQGNWYLNGAESQRPEAGAYNANLAAANTMFVTRLYDRLGETQYIDALTGEQKVTSMWLRNEGGHNRSRDDSGALRTQSNRYVLQLGGDIAQWSNNGQDSFHLGVMAGYGDTKSNTVSTQSSYDAKGAVDGYSIGVYGVWYANAADKSGLYVDGWLQYSWFNNTVTGQGLASETYKSKGLTASVESGYTFKLGESIAHNISYFIQPKAQLTWMGVKADDHNEANGTRVTGEGDGNLQTRLGVKAFIKGYSDQDKAKERVFQPFVEVNWLHNSKDFGSNMDGTSVKQDGAANIAELKVGVEGQLNKRLNLWGNVGQQIGNKGYSDTAVMLGIKYNF